MNDERMQRRVLEVGEPSKQQQRPGDGVDEGENGNKQQAGQEKQSKWSQARREEEAAAVVEETTDGGLPCPGK